MLAPPSVVVVCMLVVGRIAEGAEVKGMLPRIAGTVGSPGMELIELIRELLGVSFDVSAVSWRRALGSGDTGDPMPEARAWPDGMALTGSEPGNSAGERCGCSIFAVLLFANSERSVFFCC